MKKSVALLFGIKFEGIQAGDALNEEIDIIINDIEAFVEGLPGNEETESVAYTISLLAEFCKEWAAAYPILATMA